MKSGAIVSTLIVPPTLKAIQDITSCWRRHPVSLLPVRWHPLKDNPESLTTSGSKALDITAEEAAPVEVTPPFDKVHQRLAVDKDDNNMRSPAPMHPTGAPVKSTEKPKKRSAF